MEHLEKAKRKIHPKDRHNCVSNTFFIYAIQLFRKGFKKDLEEQDLYEVLQNYRSKQLGDQLEEEWEKQKKKKKHLSIVRLLLHCYGFYYLLLGFMQLFINVLVIIIKPYALGKLVAYFAPGQTDLTKQDAYFYAVLLLGFNFFQNVYSHNYYLLLANLGIKVRAAISSFMYRKSIKISPAYLGGTSVGRIVTMITKDVDTFQLFIDFGNDIWIGFVKTLVVGLILYLRIGFSALVGIAYLLLVMPLQIYIGSKVTPMRLEMCKKSDERLQLTQETLSAIRIIKMYNWEKVFNDKIAAARKQEIYTTYKLFGLRFLVLAIGSLNSYIAFYLMLMSFVWFGNSVSAEVVYFIMTSFQSLSYGLSILFPLGVYQTAELKSSIKRFGEILKTPELEPEQNITGTILPKISLKNVSVSIQKNVILKNMSVSFEQGLTLITGAVGSGKSTLMKTILQEFAPQEGTLKVEGTISYASQDPWLFPSSIRQNILFGQEYNEKRYNQVLKICALSYDFDLLEAGDSTIVEDRGINLSKGQQARINLARAIYKDSDIYLLDDSLAALDAHVTEFIFKSCILEFLKDKLVILVSHNARFAKEADVTVVLQDGQVAKVGKMPDLTEYEIVESKTKENEDEDSNEESKLLGEATTQRRVYEEAKQSGEVTSKVYKKYLEFGGGYFAIFLVMCVYIAAQFCMSYTDKLVSNWVNVEEEISNLTTSNSSISDELVQKRTFIFYMYSFMTVATAVATFARAVALLFFTRTASIKLHKQMITTIVNASMHFFDTNFIGNILNRFSKDLMTIDEHLPFTLTHVFRVFLVTAGIITLIASVNTIFLIPATIFIGILILLRRYCLRTSRSLKRLDALTRSPVIGHLNATLEGLTSIRAFKAQKILRDEFDRHLDLYTSAAFSLTSCIRAFAFTMDTLCTIFISFVVIRFLVNDNDILAGHVGLAISQAFTLTGTLQWGIRQWAEIENRMTSVERVLEYTEIGQENRQGLVEFDWPSLGEIVYDKVYLTYTNSSEFVLKNINFVVKPKEKIGVVGRTGAGKSSIIATLFRLYEVQGNIRIDGVDTKTISLDYLREKISIIPQDPVLFTGTFRDNIDPLKKYTDGEIWKAVQVSHLEKLVPSLDHEIIEGGANFSIGQKQLICLARAVVQKNKIIVLDEATANMDAETDQLIYQTIQENFRDCTVFTIAHKLQSILQSDKIMVLDKGEIVEYDSPSSLLQNQNGFFYKMCAKSGLNK